MRKEFQTMLIVIVCAILGVVSAMIVNTMYVRGQIIDEFITGTITIDDLMFVVFFAWLVVGIIIGVLKH